MARFDISGYCKPSNHELCQSSASLGQILFDISDHYNPGSPEVFRSLNCSSIHRVINFCVKFKT
uniref:Uncharacterized protein n=1 Tax=Arion vulgaris TaxID=1028688 RepID=A0A0B6YBM8_9EUPU